MAASRAAGSPVGVRSITNSALLCRSQSRNCPTPCSQDVRTSGSQAKNPLSGPCFLVTHDACLPFACSANVLIGAPASQRPDVGNRASLSDPVVKDNADNVLNSIDRENVFADTANRVTRGSDTAMGARFNQFLGEVSKGQDISSDATLTGTAGKLVRWSRRMPMQTPANWRKISGALALQRVPRETRSMTPSFAVLSKT